MVKYIPDNWKLIETQDTPINTSPDGYGSKIPTRWRVKDNGRHYSVYAICYGNACSHYILVGKRRLFIQDCRFP